MKQRQNLGIVFFTEESAMTEPAWQGAGTEPGLKIWRIVVGTLHSVLKQIKCRQVRWS